MARCISGAIFEGRGAREFVLTPFRAHGDKLRQNIALQSVAVEASWQRVANRIVFHSLSAILGGRSAREFFMGPSCAHEDKLRQNIALQSIAVESS